MNHAPIHAIVPAAPAIVNKVWNYAHVLRDDGVSYGDYVEQIASLLFLKMDHECCTLLYEASPIPGGYNWQSLANKDGMSWRFTTATSSSISAGNRGC